MRGRAALLTMALAAPALSSAPRPSPPPVPPNLAIQPPMVVIDPSQAAPVPLPEWILDNRVPEFHLCAACHDVEQNGRNKAGPNLYGVFGRSAAAQPDYLYSPSLAASGLVWDAATLDLWLASPQALVPGTGMTFYGVKDPEKRKAIIAFLKLRSASRP